MYAANMVQFKVYESYWIAADDSYVCDAKIITLKLHRNMHKILLATHLISLSVQGMHIENSFGMFMERLCIFWYPIQFNLALKALIIQPNMLLHYFSIKEVCT